MSGPVLRCHRFTVTSSLQEAVETWEAETTGPADFLSAPTDPHRVVDLDVGLLDPDSNTVESIAVMRQGVIDEWRLSLGKAEAVSGLKGRDAIANLLDKEFPAKRFARYPLKEDVSGATDMPTVVGTFTARQVAQEVALWAGLELRWECPDYTLWEDFEATGRPFDILGRLVQPWQVVEPFHVDLWCEGTVAYLRQRTMVPPVADYVLEVRAKEPGAHVRIQGLTIRRRRLPKWSGVQLTGRVEPGAGTHSYDPGDGIDGVPSNTISVIPFEREVDPSTGAQSFKPGQQEQTTGSRSYNEKGELLTRVVETTTYQMPDQVVLRVSRDTYSLVKKAMAHIKKEVKTIDYGAGAFKYDEKGPTGTPVPIAEYARVSQLVKNKQTKEYEMREVKALTTRHVYDQDRYLRTTSELTEMDRDGQMVPTTLILKHYVDAVPLMHHMQVDRYRFEKAKGGEGAGAAATGPVSGTFILIQSDISLVAGHRPGGHGRGSNKPLGSDTEPNTAQPLFYPAHAFVLSPDEDAKPAEAGSEHMSDADLSLIRGWYAQASGAWEVELEFTALTMPWLRRGKVVQLVGVEVPDVDADGELVHDVAGNVVMVPVSLPPALVYHVRTDYDQGRAAQKRSISSVRCVFWEEGPDGGDTRRANRQAHRAGVP